jgi:hypothetical protein
MIVKTVGLLSLAFVVWTIPAACAADNPYAIKVVENTSVPNEASEAVAKLLSDRCVQFVNGQGDLVAEWWFRKGAPAKATDAQMQNGLTYRELPETTLIGLVRLSQPLADYRKQKVMPGVYTVRLAIQPVTDDHFGTAPEPEFCLLCPAAEDKDPACLAPKSLWELSTKSTGKHPAVLLLISGKGAKAEPRLVNNGASQWVLQFRLEVEVAGKTATLSMGLTLIGSSPSA